MERIDAMKYYESLPKETQELITNVMFSTIDMCNELLDAKLVFFEDVAYRVMRSDMLEHMLEGKWFDALGDRTWKQKGEVTSYNPQSKQPQKQKVSQHNDTVQEIQSTDSTKPRYVRFYKSIDYWLEMVELDGQVYDQLDEDDAWDRLCKEWPTLITDKDELELIIDIETGRVTNWPPNKTAYFTTVKIVDSGHYELLSEDRSVLKQFTGYVPDFLSIETDGWGDYLEFVINENGYIPGWKLKEEILKEIDEKWK